MSNPWLRLYSEFSHDPKVQMLSEAMQRRYIMLMCLRCSDVLVTLHDEEVAFHLRISNDDLAETKALFITKKFIDSKWNLLNWEKRQFASDASKTRVAKHRKLQKEKQNTEGNAHVTLQTPICNGLEEIQIRRDTDTDKKRDKSEARLRPPHKPEGVTEMVWSDWLALRKAKRAPVSETVLRDAETEAQKAGMSLDSFLAKWCSRGSQGLEASWLKPDEKTAGQNPNKQEALEARNQAVADRFIANLEREHAAL